MSDNQSLLLAAVVTFALGLFVQKGLISVAHRLGILDIPNARRRHSSPTPITGGLALFATWTLGLLIFSWFHPGWLQDSLPTLIPLSVGTIILLCIGVTDDLKGLGPKYKLFFQSLAAIFILAFEPQIHQICVDWEVQIGVSIWALAFFWIVGITNSINLIDGIDGLAGGTSTLVAISILMLGLWSKGTMGFVTVAMALLIPSTLAFLKFNWNPAKVFLGDSGSLVIGFWIAAGSLMCRPQSKSWIMLASVIMMLGFPILDMGLAVYRRLRNKSPIFKADRSHLHYRIQRLGLTTSQTTIVLLSISFYLQITSLCINLMTSPAATLTLAIVGFSLFTLLFLIQSIEISRVNHLGHIKNSTNSMTLNNIQSRAEISILEIDIRPLTEAGLHEEKERYHALVELLINTLRLVSRQEDEVILSDHRISIVLSEFIDSRANRTGIKKKYEDKVLGFLNLMNLQCPNSNLNVTLKKRSVLVRNNVLPTTLTPPTRKDSYRVGA